MKKLPFPGFTQLGRFRPKNRVPNKRGGFFWHFRLVLLIFLIAAVNCRGARMNDLRSLDVRLGAVTPSYWDSLSTKKIYFGHQSVGLNIIDGIKAQMERNSAIRLDIRETSNPEDLANSAFAHSPIGQNMDPKSKIDDFRRILESGVGQVANFAMFKFCFVDVDHLTDIESLFNYYDETITSLEKRFPSLSIITFTVPLTNMPSGIKPIIKRMLGMMPPCRDDNRIRNLFNNKLRNRFKEYVFDLAKAESTTLDGNRVSFKDGTEVYELLNPDYTDDGGHLNSLGRQAIATEFLLYLLSIGNN